jgi:hypothetical protein
MTSRRISETIRNKDNLPLPYTPLNPITGAFVKEKSEARFPPRGYFSNKKSVQYIGINQYR